MPGKKAKIYRSILLKMQICTKRIVCLGFGNQMSLKKFANSAIFSYLQELLQMYIDRLSGEETRRASSQRHEGCDHHL